MYALEIRFAAGRYHATGWDHHVNEGTVEWPPSPYRLLRAACATGFKLGWGEARIRAAVMSLRGLPHYRLPLATAGHTRHFMPTDSIPIDKGRTLVFDTFYAFARGATLGVSWPEAEPDAAARADLDTLWRSVAYLGRAESWAECEPTEDIGEPDVVPDSTGIESILLPALASPEELPRLRESLVTGSRKKKKGGPWLPDDPWGALLINTGEVQRAGWSSPPGVRKVRYGLRRRALVTPVRQRGLAPRTPCHFALFALASVVPPDLRRTVSVADRVRRAVMSRTTWLDDEGHRLRKRRSDPDTLISGKAPDGSALKGHQHAFWLPFSAEPRSSRLDRLLVWLRAEEGFSARAIEAMKSLQRVWGDDQYDVSVVLLGVAEDARAGATNLIGPARNWVSDTPFVPTRHPKRQKGRDSIPDQVRLGLSQVGFPEPRSVEPSKTSFHGLNWWEIQARRRGGGSQARWTGVGVRIVFDEPVEGPIAIGWGAHFGMGRFRVAGSESEAAHDRELRRRS